MPPFQDITTYLAIHYNPHLQWRYQYQLIREMAWMLYSNTIPANRRLIGKAIVEGISQALQNQHPPMYLRIENIRRIKENAIYNIVKFSDTPEYWRNIP